jgi:hypothetical protein
MLVFIMVGLTAFVCNIGQGQCGFINPNVMQGIVGAGAVELIFEGMVGFLKVFRKKDNGDED